ncbi:hypothetical protein FDECE_322 [Fusarium decemcellulare]|nr:hypothetical protein FDECE_322 [Fusarium decemcellulare]
MERMARRRRRPALSCIECRRRKIKCDRSEPCAHCVLAKLSCEYRFYRQSGVAAIQHPLSPSTAGESPVPRNQQRSAFDNETLSCQSTSTPAVEQQGNAEPHVNGRYQTHTHPPSSTQDTEPQLHDLLLRVQKLEESTTPSPIRGLSETGRNILTRQSGLQDSQIILNKTRVLRWSHWMGAAPEFEPIHECFNAANGNRDGVLTQDPDTEAEIAEVGNLLRKCKDVAKTIKRGRPGNGMPSLEIGHPPIDRGLADTMANQYLQTFELVYRIFHIPSFWIEYQRYWNAPENAPVSLRLKVLLVIGIGSSLNCHSDTAPGFRDMVHQWIYAAQTWLSGPLKKDRLDLSGLQIYCLTIISRQIFSIGGDLVWISAGSLIHRAMQVGLHRDPKHLPPMPLLQAELRRRLWTTILEMTVQSALDTAMPPRISFEEFDTQAPANIDDDDLAESIVTLRPRPRNVYTQMSTQLILLDSLPTRLRILQLLSGLHSELSYMDTLALGSEIADAWRSYHDFLRANEFFTTPFHRNMIEYLVRRFMIPLHCPFASKARTNPLFHYSLKVSLDAATAIMSPEPDEGFSRLMSINSGLFREGLRYAFTIITFDLIQQTELQRLEGTLRRNLQHREALKKTVRDMMDLSLERIRQGETNIKSHMFLNMILALVEAREAGIAHEFRIAQSARESLELCHDLLRSQVGSSSNFGAEEMGFASASLDEQGGTALDFDLEFFLSDTDFS